MPEVEFCYMSFVGYGTLKYFLSVHGLSFYHLSSVFEEQTLLILVNSNLLTSFYGQSCPYFFIISKKSLPTSRSQKFYYLFQNFIIFALTFRSMVCFEFIFVYGMRYGLKFISFNDSFVQNVVPFIEKVILSTLNCLCVFLKNQFFIYGQEYLYCLCSLPLFCLSIFSQ